MGMYYLKNKYFEGVAFGKSIQADNLFSSYLDIFFCATMDKWIKNKKCLICLPIIYSLVTLQRALRGLAGEQATLQWAGEQIIGEVIKTESADALKNLSYKGKTSDRVSVYRKRGIKKYQFAFQRRDYGKIKYCWKGTTT